MAITRRLIRCQTCNDVITLRLVVPIGERPDPFLFPCPRCEAPLHGTFTLQFDPPAVHIKSNDFAIENVEAKLSDPYPIATVATDLPVHKTNHTKPLTEGGSPYLWLVKLMPKEFMAYHDRAAALELIRSRGWPSIKKAVTFAETSDWAKACAALGDAVDELLRSGANPTNACFRVFDMLFLPLIDVSSLVTIKEEWFQHLNDCNSKHTTDYVDLLKAFVSTHGFDTLKAKVFSVYRRLIDHFDTVMLGMLYTGAPPTFKTTVNEYRLFRADYDVIKAVYVDIFELISQATLFLDAVVNLSIRSNAEAFAAIEINGKVVNIATFARFKKLVAHDRFKTLHELPQLSAFVLEVSRPMRNDIGHFNALYDYRSGDLVYDDKSRLNYLEFSESFLAAAKAVALLLTIVEKIEIDRSTHNV